MKYKLRKGTLETECNERNLKIYTNEGWEIVQEATPPQKKSDDFQKLTKAQLQELCKEKGIEYKHTDKKAILINKLEIVVDKTLFEKKPSNDGFNDSLIRNE